MDAFDLVIRNGTVATAADVFAADVGIRGGRIAALAKGLPQGAREIERGQPMELKDTLRAISNETRGWLKAWAGDFTEAEANEPVGNDTAPHPLAWQLGHLATCPHALVMRPSPPHVAQRSGSGEELRDPSLLWSDIARA